MTLDRIALARQNLAMAERALAGANLKDRVLIRQNIKQIRAYLAKHETGASA